jgi:hypothetical protein
LDKRIFEEALDFRTLASTSFLEYLDFEGLIDLSGEADYL